MSAGLERFVEFRGVDDPDEAGIEDIRIAGIPLGKLVFRAEKRAKRTRSEVGEKPEHIEGDLWTVLEELIRSCVTNFSSLREDR